MPKHFKLIISVILPLSMSCQRVVKEFCKDSSYSFVKGVESYRKISVPESYKPEILTALAYYPELRDKKLKFKLKKNLAPLAARPTLFSAFRRPSKRTYLVVISNKTMAKLNPILLSNLGYNARIGVLGHELSHVSFFSNKRSWYFFKLAFQSIFSRRAIDKMEFETDQRCIEHGLGFQLLSWSREVREKLKLPAWGGAQNPEARRERYMNPGTILTRIERLEIYKG